MQKFLVDLLVCPVCHQALSWQIEAETARRIEAGLATCRGCGAHYPVQKGIGVFLTPDLPREDLWEEMGSGLARYLRANPEIARQLLETPLENLEPADQFFRAAVLEEQNNWPAALRFFEAARSRLYTPEYLICHESQMHFVVDALAGTTAPVLDLASGRGELVEHMARHLYRPIIVTDLSPRILHRNRRWLEFLGLYDRISLLAFDARRSPFTAGSVPAMTTNLGLANIRQPAGLLGELRRILSGQLLAVTTFYPEDDLPNHRAIQTLDLPLLWRSYLEAAFEEAGWDLDVRNACAGRAAPTPTSALLEGAGIDSLPVQETQIEWATVCARPRP